VHLVATIGWLTPLPSHSVMLRRDHNYGDWICVLGFLKFHSLLASPILLAMDHSGSEIGSSDSHLQRSLLIKNTQ